MDKLPDFKPDPLRHYVEIGAPPAILLEAQRIERNGQVWLGAFVALEKIGCSLASNRSIWFALLAFAWPT